MASISWAVSGGRVVEVVDGQMRVTDISVEDYNAGRLPYGQVVGDPFTMVPHQDSPWNFDVTNKVVPWIEELYRGDPLPGMQPGGTRFAESDNLDPAGSTTIFDPRFVYPVIKTGPGSWTPPATPSGSGLDTGTGAPKPLAVIGPRDEFIGGQLGEIRVVGPGPLVGESTGIRMGTLPRIVLKDMTSE